jgi:polyisoprenoid-binding protein YceI
MKTLLMISAYLMLIGPLAAQQYFTKTGYISFYSSAPLEDITAENNQVTSIVDFGTGEMAFSLLMKGFHFEKALMEEHFNEKYVHSDKYPKSTFEGNITNIDNVDLTSDGEYEVDIEGKLTIHGVTKDVSTTGTIKVEGEKLSGE